MSGEIFDLVENNTPPTRARSPSGLRHCLQEGDSALAVGLAKEQDGMRRVASGEVVVRCFALGPNFYKPFRHPGEDNPSLLRNKLKFGNMPVGSKVEISSDYAESLGTTLKKVQKSIYGYSSRSGKRFIHYIDDLRNALMIERRMDG